MARPTELNEVIARRIVAAIAAGASRRCAAASAGIARSTLMSWIARGRAGDPIYAELATSIDVASARAEMAMGDVLYDAAKGGDWRAALEWLARRRPSSWAAHVPAHRVTRDDVSLLTDGELHGALVRSIDHARGALALTDR